MTALAELAAAYSKAKADEARATAIRRELADQIVAVTGHAVEGQKIYEADGWKVTVKAPLIRSMDWAAWESVKARIPQELWPVEMKPSLDEKGVRWLQKNDPKHYAALAEALTVKPGAVQVTVKES
mgnify:FL=1